MLVCACAACDACANWKIKEMYLKNFPINFNNKKSCARQYFRGALVGSVFGRPVAVPFHDSAFAGSHICLMVSVAVRSFTPVTPCSSIPHPLNTLFSFTHSRSLRELLILSLTLCRCRYSLSSTRLFGVFIYIEYVVCPALFSTIS